MMKDMIGREIKPGDFVVKSSSSYVQLRVNLVLKLNPKTVGLNAGGVASPEQLIVVTEQLVASGRQDLVDQLMKEYGSQIDTSTPKPKSTTKWRYLVFESIGRVYVVRLAADDKAMLAKSRSDAFHRIIPDFQWYDQNQLRRLIHKPATWRGPESASFGKPTYGSELHDVGLSALRFTGITPDMVERDYSLEDFKSLTKNINWTV